MIRAVIALLPANQRPRMRLHLLLTVLSVIVRSIGTVLLISLVAALFGPDPASAWPWLGALAAATALGWVLDTVISTMGFDIGFALLTHTESQIADRINEIRLDWFTAGNTATTRHAIAATGPELVRLIGYLITPLLTGVGLPIGIGLALLPISWPLGVAALVGVPLLLGAFFGAARLSRGADRATAAANVDLTERLVEFARTQQVLRASRRADGERGLAGAALARQHGASLRLVAMQIPGQLVFSLVTQLVLVLLAGTTVVLGVTGTLSAPEAVAMIVVIARYLEPYGALAELAGVIDSARTALRDLSAVLAAPTTPRGSERPVMAAPTIRFEQVGFAYGEGPAVLDDFELELAAGSTTAIVGPSGSGKSTVLQLIAGLHAPTHGQIVVDGHRLDALTEESLRDLVSVVFQEPYLFDGSIADNVRTGSPEATDEDIARVAALARVDELIDRLPDGWHSRVGEGGVALSGGERQRVSIARALLKPAPVLLVDEATSALDTENETAVARALSDDPVRRTRVIVAHRLSSISAADRVVFIDQGRIVEDGTIPDLLAADGRFASYWKQQQAASEWQITH